MPARQNNVDDRIDKNNIVDLTVTDNEDAKPLPSTQSVDIGADIAPLLSCDPSLFTSAAISEFISEFPYSTGELPQTCSQEPYNFDTEVSVPSNNDNLNQPRHGSSPSVDNGDVFLEALLAPTFTTTSPPLLPLTSPPASPRPTSVPVAATSGRCINRAEHDQNHNNTFVSNGVWQTSGDTNIHQDENHTEKNGIDNNNSDDEIQVVSEKRAPYKRRERGLTNDFTIDVDEPASANETREASKCFFLTPTAPKPKRYYLPETSAWKRWLEDLADEAYTNLIAAAGDPCTYYTQPLADERAIYVVKRLAFAMAYSVTYHHSSIPPTMDPVRITRNGGNCQPMRIGMHLPTGELVRTDRSAVQTILNRAVSEAYKDWIVERLEDSDPETLDKGRIVTSENMTSGSNASPQEVPIANTPTEALSERNTRSDIDPKYPSGISDINHELPSLNTFQRERLIDKETHVEDVEEVRIVEMASQHHTKVNSAGREFAANGNGSNHPILTDSGFDPYENYIDKDLNGQIDDENRGKQRPTRTAWRSRGNDFQCTVQHANPRCRSPRTWSPNHSPRRGRKYRNRNGYKRLYHESDDSGDDIDDDVWDYRRESHWNRDRVARTFRKSRRHRDSLQNQPPRRPMYFNKKNASRRLNSGDAYSHTSRNYNSHKERNQPSRGLRSRDTSPHKFRKYDPRTEDLYVANTQLPVSNKGFGLLQRMGWRAGDTLGAFCGNGLREPLQPRGLRYRAGVGSHLE